MANRVTVFIALGSNQGDRRAHLREAVRRIADCLAVERRSSVYETEPAYVTSQPRFLNMVLVGRTGLEPHALLDCLKRIERAMGRASGMRWGPRPIDLDILLYGDRQLEAPDLQIPHPRLAERPFVLQSLAELAPDLRLPGFAAPVEELAQHAPPIGEVLARLGPL